MARLKKTGLSALFSQGLVSSCSLLVLAPLSMVFAEEGPEPNKKDETTLEEVVVVGSHIRGARIDGQLPVTLVNKEDIDVIGATSAEDLLKAVPQVGNVQFNSDSEGTSSNDVRGDVASLNLRGLGADSTLPLINGRRMVIHPGSTTDDGVPIHFVNLNTLPTLGVKRVEVLRDGAAAIYGTDAVAGVVNNVLDTDFEGLEVSMRYGSSQGTSLNEKIINARGGFTLNDGATNITAFIGMSDRSGMKASERSYSANSDMRFLLPEEFQSDLSARNNSSFSQFGQFRTGVATGDFGEDSTGFDRTRVSGWTTSSGQFHLQPVGIFPNASQQSGDLLPQLPGYEIDDGSSTSTSTSSGNGIDNGQFIVNPLRFDQNGDNRLIVPDRDRLNLFGTITHEFDSGMKLFSEWGYYKAETSTFFGPHVISGSNNFIIPAQNYYNPFGPLGSPNKVAGPDEGLDVDVEGYRVLDAGNRTIRVDNTSYRVVVGLEGNWEDWEWEGALYHSEGESNDRSEQLSRSLMFAAASRTDASAYNFWDAGTQQQDVDFVVTVARDTETKLQGADFKVSNGNLFALPAGDVGVALGMDYRREDWSDDRDDRLDGTISFTNPLTGEFFDSDIMGVSATPDASGDRDVLSTFAEFAVPLLADMPLVQSLDAQLAVRREDYSDFGSVTKPKVALSWRVNDYLMFRGAKSEGFRAPNLETVNQTSVSRFGNGLEDFLRCEITGDDSDCSRPITSNRLGNPDLGPEESKNTTFGVVIQPTDDLTFTVDYWKIEQEGIVGLFGRDNLLLEDIVLRSQGSSSSSVVRFAPTEADQDAIDIFNSANGTSLAAIGELRYVEDTFFNLQPRTIRGIDTGIRWNLDTDEMGSFTFKGNIAYLKQYDQAASPREQALLEAISDPGFQALYGVTVSDADVSEEVGSQIQNEKLPRVRATVSATWRNGQWGAGLFGQMVGHVYDQDITSSVDGRAYKVESYTTFNGYAQYRFDGGSLDGVRVRLGARNLLDKEPPLFPDSSRGYSPELHSAYGRYMYLDVRKQFNLN
ncbi:TonB-dependent receptor [Porticoccaceae bacterium LTM1]|nr:TonB-dependent receptor [Porticoccaceae bacterium LTM1]